MSWQLINISAMVHDEHGDYWHQASNSVARRLLPHDNIVWTIAPQHQALMYIAVLDRFERVMESANRDGAVDEVSRSLNQLSQNLAEEHRRLSATESHRQ